MKSVEDEKERLKERIKELVVQLQTSEKEKAALNAELDTQKDKVEKQENELRDWREYFRLIKQGTKLVGKVKKDDFDPEDQ